MSKSYSQEHGKIDAPDGLDSEVKTLSVSLRATSGVTDLSFISRLRVTMASDDGSEAIELGVYEPARGAVVGDTTSLTMLNRSTSCRCGSRRRRISRSRSSVSCRA